MRVRAARAMSCHATPPWVSCCPRRTLLHFVQASRGQISGVRLTQEMILGALEPYDVCSIAWYSSQPASLTFQNHHTTPYTQSEPNFTNAVKIGCQHDRIKTALFSVLFVRFFNIRLEIGARSITEFPKAGFQGNTVTLTVVTSTE